MVHPIEFFQVMCEDGKTERRLWLCSNCQPKSDSWHTQIVYASLHVKLGQCKIQTNGSAGIQEGHQRVINHDLTNDFGGQNLELHHQHVITTATYTDRLVMSGHTNTI